jgi:MFS family permease
VPPAGGAACRGLVVLSAFAASFVVFGVVYSFGVFLQPVAAEFHADPVQASGFFSITSLVYYAVGAFAGRAADRLGPRIVVTTGAPILGLGLCLTALGDNIWFGYVTFGLGVGIGGACCFVPTRAVVGHWFQKHRNAALGMAAAGTGAGTMVVPLVAAALIHDFGWRQTDLVFGAAAVAILLGCAALVRSPPPMPSSSIIARSPRDLFWSRDFVLLYLSWLLATMALFVSLVFLPTFAREHGASEIAAAALLSLFGGCEHPQPADARPDRRPDRSSSFVQDDSAADGDQLRDMALVDVLRWAGGVRGRTRSQLRQSHRGRASGTDRTFRRRRSLD